VKMIRRSPSRSRSTRFSALRHSITAACCRCNQPATTISMNCRPVEAAIKTNVVCSSVYRQSGQRNRMGAPSQAEFWNITRFASRVFAGARNGLTSISGAHLMEYLRITPRRRSDPIQLGPSIGLPTARYSSRTWLAARYCGRMFSSGMAGTRDHRYGIEAGPTLSGGASGASLVSRFGRSLNDYSHRVKFSGFPSLVQR
jgi:hypothetical protein